MSTDKYLPTYKYWSTHFAITVIFAHQILASVTNITGFDSSALAD